jgi:hypothetical protein
VVESAALLVDDVLPREPLRQGVFSVPFPLRYLFATAPGAMGVVLGIKFTSLERLGNRLRTACRQCGTVILDVRRGDLVNLPAAEVRTQVQIDQAAI